MKRGFTGGSYDPVTVGHIDLIERSAKLCDTLTVAVLWNKEKNCLFSVEQRVEMLKAALKHIPNVEVIAYSGHMATYVLENGYDVVFRGLRNASDFDYEIEIAQLSAKFFGDRCETVYLMSDPALSYISSSIVRQNYTLGADVSGWVSEEVLRLMDKYYKSENKG